MYKEYVIGTNPYSYWPLDSVSGAVDIMERSGDFSSITTPSTSSTPPKPYQPLVPGYYSSVCTNSSATVGRGFGTAQNETVPFTIDGWFSTNQYNSYSVVEPRDIFYYGDHLVGFSGSNMYLNFDGITTQFRTPDTYQSFYLAITWTGSALSVLVDGVRQKTVEAPSGFEFSNTSTVLNIKSRHASHVSLYDRALTDEEILRKYLFAKNSAISHSDACANDNGIVFKFRAEKDTFYEVKLDDEFVSSESIAINIDSDGRFSNRVVDALTYESAPTWGGTYVTIGSGEYLEVPAVNYLGSDEWVIYIEGQADDTRAGNEYLLSLIGDRQRVSFYVTSSNILKVDVIDVDSVGAETSNTITFDTAVSTNNKGFAFIYSGGLLSAWTDGGAWVLNQVSGNDTVEATMVVDQSTQIVLGADDQYGGTAVPGLAWLVTHNSVLDETTLQSNYSYYLDVNRCTGAWPLTDTENVGIWQSSLKATFALPPDDPIKCAYIVSDGQRGMTPNLTTSDSSMYAQSVYTPATPIPFNATPGTEITDLVSISVEGYSYTEAYPNAANYPSMESVSLICYTDRIVKSENSDSYISFSGDGAVWINPDDSDRFSRNKYDGIAFDSGSVGGVIIDPNVDTVTVRYSYRAIEFMMYIDKDLINSGRVISIYDGSTERYLSINAGGNSLTHNFSTAYINNINMSGKSISEMYNQWVHVYVELAGLVQDQQLYIGRGYNSSNPVNGIAIQNLATYPVVLSAANREEHTAAFLGRYSFQSDVIDSVTIAQNAAPSIYSPAWHTNVIPV